MLERLATVVESAMKSVPAKSYKDRRTYERHTRPGERPQVGQTTYGRIAKEETLELELVVLGPNLSVLIDGRSVVVGSVDTAGQTKRPSALLDRSRGRGTAAYPGKGR